MRLALTVDANIGTGRIFDEFSSISALQLRAIYPETEKKRDCDYIYHSKAPLMSSNKNLVVEWSDWFPELFSFSTGPACKKVRIKDFYYDARSPILGKKELKEEIKRKIDIIKENFPNKIAIENTNYYPFPAYEHVTDPEFLAEVVEENDIYFCFDIAHHLVTCGNAWIDCYPSLESILDLLGSRIIEIHLSKPGIVGDMWRDLHEAPNGYEFSLLEKVLKKCKLDPYVVVEYDRCSATLIEVYKELEERFC